MSHGRVALSIGTFGPVVPAAVAALRDDGDLLDLPPRLAMFGLTTLPATYPDDADRVLPSQA